MIDPQASRQRRKAMVIVAIMVPIALLHFVTGPQYAGPFRDFVNGYLIDIVLPMGVYFLLTPQDEKITVLAPWYAKAIPVFLLGVVVETLQYYGIPLFGRTFDPLDYLAYGAGVVLAVLLDCLLFPRIFSFWKVDSPPLEH